MKSHSPPWQWRSPPMLWAIMRYSELAASVSLHVESTSIQTVLESESIWKDWTASEIPFSIFSID
ncbi:MAG TPA: hypothetical protein VNY05_10930 [Candidatus Acidoferrales bacterium]|jgi:hypothetical protein|nr:hypothetical protein [Candidatus Acidoferrales bacterium]